jgi:hypothetical protein
MPFLRQLDSRGNPIQSLPEELARLPRLEKVYFAMGRFAALARMIRRR